jgi:addiction module RelE/StbE family toxin
MKIVFTDTAKASLREIGRYIARDSKTRAVSFVQELRKAALALSDYPEAYPLIQNYERYGHRLKPYKDYLIIYTAFPDRIIIDAILHGARNYTALLFPES